MFASRHFWPAFAAWLLILLHQYGNILRIPAGRTRLTFLICLLLAFGSGRFYALWRMPAETLPQPQASQTDIWSAADNREEAPAGRKTSVPLRLQAKVVSVQGRSDQRLRLILEDMQTGGTALAGRLAFTWRHSLTPEGTPETAEPQVKLPRRPVPGDEVDLTLRPVEVRGFSNYNLWNPEEYWARQGVFLRAWAAGETPALQMQAGEGPRHTLALWREKLRLKTLAALPQDSRGAGLIPALLFGDQYLLGSDEMDLFARSTLAHSLALSGMHLGYAAAMGYLIVRLLYLARPGLALPRRLAAVPAGGAAALIYLWLGGAPPSLLRAFLMLACLGIQLWRRRPQALADALLAALALILLARPEAAFDLGLQLSALSLATICLLLPPSQRLAASLHGAGRFLRGPALIFLTSLGIQLVLAPLLVLSFNLLGLALPLNVLWLPILGFLVLPLSFAGLLAAAIQLQSLAQTLFLLASLPCDWLLQGLRWLDASSLLPVILPPRPHWLSMLAYWFLLALLPALWGFWQQLLAKRNANEKPRLSELPGGKARGGGVSPKILCGQAAFGLLLLAAPPAWQLYDSSREAVRLRLLDVGQGQAVLLEWQGGKRLLLDGGGSNVPGSDPGREVIAPSLAENRLPGLEYMLVSHLDADHARGLIFPLRHLPVRYYADNGQMPERDFSRELILLLEKRDIPRRRLQAGDVLDLAEDLRLEILHPARDNAAGNDDSLVARLVWRGRGLALICGDAEKKAQREMLRRLPKDALRSEVLILPHHGSAGALLPAFYQAVEPRLALVSAGWRNPWNFPVPQVKNSLRNLNIPLLNTARCGQICLEWQNPLKAPSLKASRLGTIIHGAETLQAAK